MTSRIADLWRRAAAEALQDPAIGEAMDEQTVSSLPEPIRSDPVFVASLRATNQVNIAHWLAHVVTDPTRPVPPARSREGLAFGRDLVRRGHDASALTIYLSGQNAAWRLWMQHCARVTEDAAELAELLDRSSQSMFTFVQVTIAEVGKIIGAERGHLTEGSNAERLELVGLVLDGAEVAVDSMTARLRHDMRRLQTAAILWQDAAADDRGALERAALAAAAIAGVSPPLLVRATSSSLWAWYATADSLDPAVLREAVKAMPGVRVAVGASARGLEGFRQSHRDAVTTQRVMSRANSDLSAATYDEVRVVSLITADVERAGEFVRRTLGGLADAEPALRETLRVYLREDASAARTARALFTHRNTILNRVGRAQALLPLPLEGHGLSIGLALEIVRWFGSTPTSAP